MSVLFPLVSLGLLVTMGICSCVGVAHHRRVQAWHQQRGGSVNL